MKDQAIQYVAFDVHQATVVATLRDQSGAIVMRATVPANAQVIVTLVRGAGRRVTSSRSSLRRGASAVPPTP